jgi:Ca2+:H+ antiporter
MGMCFLFGGLWRTEQFFNMSVGKTSASLLSLTIAGVLIPTAFQLVTTKTEAPLATISRGIAIILLVIYGLYLYFMLKTHTVMFYEPSPKVAMKPRKNTLPEGNVADRIAAGSMTAASEHRSRPLDQDQPVYGEIHETVRLYGHKTN